MGSTRSIENYGFVWGFLITRIRAIKRKTTTMMTMVAAAAARMATTTRRARRGIGYVGVVGIFDGSQKWRQEHYSSALRFSSRQVCIYLTHTVLSGHRHLHQARLVLALILFTKLMKSKESRDKSINQSRDLLCFIMLINTEYTIVIRLSHSSIQKFHR